MQRAVYYTYILTNQYKTVFYTGVTNNLARRLVEHYTSEGNCFTGKYKVHYLLWFEATNYILNAIEREKEIKNFPRSKKEALVKEVNGYMKFLNAEIFGQWPLSKEEIDQWLDYLIKNPDDRGK